MPQFAPPLLNVPTVLLVVVVAVCLLSGADLAVSADLDLEQVDAEVLKMNLGPLNDGCLTQVIYDLKYPQDRTLGNCPGEGPCDDPAERNAWLFQPGDDSLRIRIFLNIFAEDDWSNPAITYPDLLDAIDTLKARYATQGITFDWDYRFINDSRYRDMDGFDEQYFAKLIYHVNSEEQCNIYVGDVHIGSSYFSSGYFPWDPDCITYSGGVMMNAYHMPPYNYTTLAHELGHNLGLWHTHHGVIEVGACGACYEFPNAADRDDIGDFCSDTYPTPITWSCYPPTMADTCSGLPWGPGEPDNLMSYSPSACRVELTPQQGARVRCWTNANLPGWLIPIGVAASTTEGEAPLNVSFTATTDLEATSWLWDFGDGAKAYEQNPSHVYQTPGLYDVRATIETAEGSNYSFKREMIWARGDTLSLPEISIIGGQQVRLDIGACNSLPLRDLYVAFTWAGQLNMQFDSVSTAGLRTDFVASKELAGLATEPGLAAFRFRTDDINLIEPGSGPVLSAWFSIPYGAHGTNALTITDYGTTVPRFGTYRGTIWPARVDGFIYVCLPGDADGDGSGPTIEDLVYLVAYMFNNGPPPPDPNTVDVDNSGGDVCISDLVYLVTYMFSAGPQLNCGF